MHNRKQTFYGRLNSRNGQFFIHPFEFTGKRARLPVTLNKHTVSDRDIVTYSLINDNTAEIQSVAARADSARADIFTIIENRQITIPYPQGVMQETAAILDDPHIAGPCIQEMGHLPFITIDNDGSRDLDQALYIEKHESIYRIYYALADCAYYIRPESHLFHEALKRGATYYFPGFSVPMLPPQLSEGTVSLNPGVERRAFVFIIDMQPDGSVEDYSCVQARIRSRARLTYTGVQAYYDNPHTSDLSNSEFTPVLDLLKEAGCIRIALASQSNRIRFNRRETSVSISGDGETFLISHDERNNCSRYNEQISLLCNALGGRLLDATDDPNIQGIFRVHEGPEEGQLLELYDTIYDILKNHKITAQEWYWDREKETLATYMERLYSFTEYDYLVETLERQVMITMRRSLFADKAGPHYALAVDPYSRFSSPMREIVGVFTHKEALEKLGLLQPGPIESDNELRKLVIKSGNRSKELQKAIERDVQKCAMDRLFRHELDLPAADRTGFTATILGAKSTRLYVRLDNPPVEVKVYTDNLRTHLQKELVYSANKLLFKDTGEIAFKPGDRLTLFVKQYQDERWCLVPLPRNF